MSNGPDDWVLIEGAPPCTAHPTGAHCSPLYLDTKDPRASAYDGRCAQCGVQFKRRRERLPGDGDWRRWLIVTLAAGIRARVEWGGHGQVQDMQLLSTTLLAFEAGRIADALERAHPLPDVDGPNVICHKCKRTKAEHASDAERPSRAEHDPYCVFAAAP